MDLMQIIEAHTTFAPAAPHLEPATVDPRPVWRSQRQAAFNAALYGEVAR